MSNKYILFFLAQTFLTQCIYSQRIGSPWRFNPWNAAIPYPKESSLASTIAFPFTVTECEVLTAATLAASNGGGFPITSVSPIIPTGIYMTSENEYKGPLLVSGVVPFLGAVALEGDLPTAGIGKVAHGCGNGNVAMVSEDVTPSYGSYGYRPSVVAAESSYGHPGLIYEATFASGYGYNRGCRCGAVH